MSNKEMYQYQHKQEINTEEYDQLDWMANWEIVNRTIDACDVLIPLVNPDLAKTNRSTFESWIGDALLKRIRAHYSLKLRELDELQRAHSGEQSIEI